MDLQPTSLLNEKSIRRIFRDWHSLKKLGQNSLADLKIVETCRREAGFANTDSGKGLALQKIFQEAVEALRPAGGSPDSRERRWRPYLILNEQLLHDQSPDVVREQLFISRGTYYGEQKRALEMLAAILQKREAECIHQGELPGKLSIPFLAPQRPGHCLVGMERYLTELKTALLQGEDRAVSALRGLPGVGKTTLAIELAHDREIQQHFEDGILWAGLGRQPAPLALLAAWAEALGVPPHLVARRTNLADRAALVHAQIGMRRVLLIIDDAWQVEAALALKVGGPNCAHLLTTRLPEVALSFALGKVIAVHELDQEDGLRLLEQISPRVVAANREQAQELVRAVGGLPLALILMGKYLQKQGEGLQTRRLHDALQKLQAADLRLQLEHLRSPLESDPNFPFSTPLSLRAAIGLSDTALESKAHLALLDLSLLPPKPSTFSEAAALVVAQTSPQVLDALVDGGLLEAVSPDRYTLHQTITDYAALQGANPTASKRLIDYFTHLVETNGQGASSLDQEISNILAACELALRLGQPAALIRLVLDLYLYLDTHGLYAIAERYLQAAHRAAEESGDRASQAAILNKWGDLEVKQARFKEARVLLEQSLALAEGTGSWLIKGETLFNLGLACAYQGEMLIAKQHLERCLQIHRQFHNEQAAAFALNGYGFTLEELGCYGEAKKVLEEALQQSRRVGERRCEGWVNYNLGQVSICLGEYEQAIAYDEACLQIYQSLADQRGEGWIAYERGRVVRQMGQYDQAEALFSQALKILSDLGDLMGAGYARLNLGLIQMDLGHPALAEDLYEGTLEQFKQIECRVGEAQAYHFLATLYRRNGDFLKARSLLEQSIQVLQAISYVRGMNARYANLALTEAHLGNTSVARQHARKALSMVEEVGALPNLAYVLTCLGQVFLLDAQWEEAGEAFGQALSIDRQLGQRHLAIEPLAGLAEITYQKGDLSEARGWVDEIISTREKLPQFSRNPDLLTRIDRPAQVYLTCFQILDAQQDPKAEVVLRSGYRLLQDWAAQIPVDQRELFLALPENREILSRLTGEA